MQCLHTFAKAKTLKSQGKLRQILRPYTVRLAQGLQPLLVLAKDMFDKLH